MNDHPERVPQQTIRGYTLRDELGDGGFGKVYRAYQTVVGRDVAIKVIHPDYANMADFIRRFEVEARIIARLEHIHIVPLYDFWRDPSGAYLVMRLLTGGSLRDLLTQNKQLSLEVVVKLMMQISAALNIAHQRGVIHRDIKPENILLDADVNGYLTDFGIAVDLIEAPDVTLQNLSYGSPEYISPEQLRGDDIAPQADIYSMGILLYELLVGQLPFKGKTRDELMRQQLTAPVPSVLSHRPDLPTSIDAIIWRATAKDPLSRYPSILQMGEALRRSVPAGTNLSTSQLIQWTPGVKSEPDTTVGTVDFRETQDADHTPVPSETVDFVSDMLGTVELTDSKKLVQQAEIQNPYKGLAAFEEADASDFFGRSSIIDEILRFYSHNDHRFLMLIGPGGSGKSSVVRAGVIPALRAGRLVGSENWYFATMVPGQNPLGQLAETWLQLAANAPHDIETGLRLGHLSLDDLNRMSLPDERDEVFLFIDQFEEVFTLCESDEDRRRFFELILDVARSDKSRVRLIATMRADFYDRPLLYEAFGELVQHHTQVLLPLNITQLEEIIIKPAQGAGMQVEPRLRDALIADVHAQPGTLPLLQYTLTELFEKRSATQLTYESYFQMGGLSGALAKRADEIYTSLQPDQQQIARQIFLSLVTVAHNNEATRRRMFWHELITGFEDPDDAQVVINRFANNRLLTQDNDPVTRAPTIEIVHEALISAWRPFGRWIEDSRVDLQKQQRLLTATEEWQLAQKDRSYLARGAQLSELESLLHESSLPLSEIEREFLKSSIALRKRNQRNRQILLVSLAVFALWAMGLAIFALDQRSVAQTAQSEAVAERDRAQAEARIAQSRALAATSLSTQQTQDLAALLAIQAWQVAETYEARNSMFVTMQQNPRLRRYMHPTDAPVRSMAYSSTGEQLAVGSADGEWSLWDVEAGTAVLAPIEAHSGIINALAIDPADRIIATGGSDGLIKLWDMADGAMLQMLDEHTDEVWSVAFSPDGEMLVSVGADGNIIAWSMDTQEVDYTIAEAHAGIIYKVAFHPDGTRFATAGDDNLIRLWDSQTGELIGEPLQGHNNWVMALAFNADGTQLASSGADTSIIIWDVAEQSPTAQFATQHGGWVRSLDFQPEGDLLVSSSMDGSVRLWNLAEGRFDILSAHRNSVWQATFRPDASQPDATAIASAGADGDVIMWQLSTVPRPATDVINFAQNRALIALSSDTSRIAHSQLSDTGVQQVTVADTVSGETLQTITGHTAPITHMALNSDGTQLLTGSFDQRAILWDVATGDVVTTFADGHTEGITQVLFSIDETTIFTGSDDGDVVLWDAETGAMQGRLSDGGGDGITAMSMSLDERYIAAGERDGHILVWDVAAQDVVARLAGHTSAVTIMLFTQDDRLISGGRDNMIHTWDMQADDPLVTSFAAHTDWVLDLAISPDQTLLASAGRDQGIILWDVAAQRAIGQPLLAHDDWILALGFDPQTQQLASVSRDGDRILWLTDAASWQSWLCDISNRALTSQEVNQYFSDSPPADICQTDPS